MKQSFVVILIIALLSACSPGAPAPTPASQPTTEALTAEATVAPTLDPTLTAMIIETSGSNTNVHDPTMIKEGSMYYLFSTGAGIPIRCSKDMKVWESCGRVFDANPDWAVKAIEGVKDLWAPDIIIHNGKYYLYYAKPTFGNNRSTIGLATNTILDPKSPNYAWEVPGQVISSQKSDNFNAIDPNLTFDRAGHPWLVFGSFWSGIKMVKVDPASLKPAAGETLLSLAAKPGSDAIEGAFITRWGDFYHLFVSHDFCCRGVMSSYDIRVSCSRDITGPYVDRDGKALTQGGGTQVQEGSNRWRGPGHNSIYIEGEVYYLVQHSHDANANAVPTLRIEALKWDPEGWPQAPSALLGE